MFDKIKPVAEVLAAVIAVVAFIGGALWYVFTLQHQIELAQREIVELRTRLETISTINATSVKGLKGDKGDKGDQGDKGDRGPAGPPGADADLAQVESLVNQVVNKVLSKTPVSQDVSADSDNGSRSSLSQNDFSQFEAACTPASELHGKETFIVQQGLEVCSDSGALIATISKTFPSYFNVSPAGNTMFTCGKNGFSCRFPWDRQSSYLVERVTEGDNGAVFLMRRQ